MGFPDDENGAVLRRMAAAGVDLTVPHVFEFFAVFPSEEAAGAVARSYVADHRAEPLAKIETAALEGGGMELLVAKSMLATHELVTGFEEELGRRAASAGGHLDGWGVLDETPEDSG